MFQSKRTAKCLRNFHRSLFSVLFATILTLFIFHFGFVYSPPVNADLRTPVKGWAVIVGVSNYLYQPDLSFCDDDAIDLYNQISSTWGADHVTLLVDAEANKIDIEHAIKNWLAPNESVDDTVLFFFSGHGANGTDIAPIDEADSLDEYICPHDSTSSPTTNIRDDELDSWFGALESGKITVILDTCYSGGFINSTATTEVNLNLTVFNDGFVKDISKNGRVILTASAEDETSRESGILGHGVFSYYVIEALNESEITDINANHEISAEEIFSYANPKTVNFTNNLQHPQLYDGYDGELPLVTTATVTFDTSPHLVSLTVDETTYPPLELPTSLTWFTNTLHSFNVSSMSSEILESVNVESPHPYPNNYNNTWTLTRPDATRMRVHFKYIRTERNWDYIYILDDAGNVYINYTGNFDDLSSVWIPGNTINVQLTSDSVVSYNGFIIDKLEWVNDQTRYIFISWNDGNTSTSRTLTVSQTETYTAIYETEYYLTVNSPYSTVGGEGWYDNWTTTYATLNAGVVDHGNGTRRVFTHWSGNAYGTNYMASDPILIDGPKTATANWKTQYLINFLQTKLDNTANSTVVTVNDTPKNFSDLPFSTWLDGGSPITYGYSTIVSSIVSSKRFMLDGVSGPPSPFIVTEPVTITANYNTQYILSVRTDPAALSPQPTREPIGETGITGWWYDNSTSVQLTAQPITGYTFLNWDIDATSVSENPVIVLIDGPCEATAHYLADTIEPSIDTPIHEPYRPSLDENVTVLVNVTDIQSKVREVILSYSSDAGKTWVNVTMSKLTGSIYIGEIPGFEAGTHVQYYIIAYDNANNPAVKDNAGGYYVYTVIPEFPAPIILPLFMFLTLIAVALAKKHAPTIKSCKD